MSADVDALHEALVDITNDLGYDGEYIGPGASMADDILALLRDPRHARAVLGLIGDVREGWLTHSASGTGHWYADTINTYMAEPVVVVSLGAATKETNNDA